MEAAQNEEKILFFGEGDPFWELSNLYPAEITIGGVTWPTTEHYFQAMKFSDPEIQEKIRKVIDYTEMKKTAYTFPNIRKDWDTYRLDVMYDCIKVKFMEHKNLQDILLSTGNKILVEHTKNDIFWGFNFDDKTNILCKFPINLVLFINKNSLMNFV